MTNLITSYASAVAPTVLKSTVYGAAGGAVAGTIGGAALGKVLLVVGEGVAATIEVTGTLAIGIMKEMASDALTGGKYRFPEAKEDPSNEVSEEEIAEAQRQKALRERRFVVDTTAEGAKRCTFLGAKYGFIVSLAIMTIVWLGQMLSLASDQLDA